MEDKRFERLDVDEHGSREHTGPVIPESEGGGRKEYLFQGSKAKLRKRRRKIETTHGAQFE